MKILMVTPILPAFGQGYGSSQVTYAQLTGLASHHELTLATMADPEPPQRDAVRALGNLGIQVEAVWCGRASGIRQLRRRFRLASNWLRGGRPLRTLWFWNPDMQRLLDKLLVAQAYDLLQIEDNAMANYRFRSRAVRVLTEHEVRAPVPSEFDIRLLPLEDLGVMWKVERVRRFVNSGEQRRWEKYQPAVWRQFDGIQVFTPRDATQIRSIAPDLADRVRVNPFGVTPVPEVDRNREENNTVVFVGMFRHPANVDAVLWLANEIMPLLRKARSGIHLMVVGGEAPQSVRALATKDVELTGYVPSVRPFLERAAVVLAPVRIGGGMRMKVLEAMSMGKAVVTTPLGAEGLSFDNREPPLLISEGSEGIANATCALLSSPIARETLARRARSYVLQYHSWSAYIQRLESMYADLLSQATRLSQSKGEF